MTKAWRNVALLLILTSVALVTATYFLMYVPIE